MRLARCFPPPFPNTNCSMTFLTRQAFAKMFETSPDDLDMHVIYDVSHNIAKVGWLVCFLFVFFKKK